MADLTRDQSRQVWTDSGLAYADLTHENLRTLRGMIDRQMRTSGLMRGSYRAHQRFSLHPSPRPTAYLRCRSHYFDDREAVTFGPEGFIGFAGWADQWNVQPILTAFVKWVDIVAAAKAMAVQEGDDP